MEDQGGAGGAPLHHHDHDEQRRRGTPPTAPGPKASPKASAKDEPTVRAADTDEASRLDRPGTGGEPARERRRPGREH